MTQASWSKEIAAAAKQARVELIAATVALQEQIEAIDEQIKVYDQIARLAEGERPKPKAKAKAPKRQSSRVSGEVKERVLAAFAAEPGRAFIKEEIEERTGISKSSLTYAVAELVNEKRLEKLGRAPRQEGQIGQAPMLFQATTNGSENGAPLEVHPDQPELDEVVQALDEQPQP